MSTLFLAIGLVLVVEGLIWAVTPSLMRKMAEQLPNYDDHTLRLVGVIVLAFGTGLVFIARHWG